MDRISCVEPLSSFLRPLLGTLNLDPERVRPAITPGTCIPFASSFDRVYAIASTSGNDLAYLYDSGGDDNFYGRANYSYLRGDNFYNYTAGFDQVFADASAGGFDHAFLNETSSNNLLVSGTPTGTLISIGSASSFDQITATTDEGSTIYNDESVLDYAFSQI